MRPEPQEVLALLRDDENTAVCEAALHALLVRGDEIAADIVFEAVATADEDIADHLLYFLTRDHALSPEGARLVSLAKRRAREGSAPVRDGAVVVLSALGAEQPGR